MKYRSRLFNVRDPYASDTDSLFAYAMKENCLFQYEHCPEYRKLLDGLDYNPDSIKDYSDIASLPFLPTLFFKNHSLFSMPQSRMPIKATSSGTNGKVSRIGFDSGGLLCGLRMVISVGRRHRLFSLTPANYIILGYKPHKGNNTAVTKTAFGSTFFAPALSRTYALRYGKDGYAPDLESIIKAIEKHGRSRFPLRFMGFPSYTYFLLKMMDERGIRVKLSKGSKIMLGGGWKQFYKEKVEKDVLYSLAQKVLGVEESDIIEFFGAAEHPILYCDCERHHFHVPVYSRVIIRDVNTLEAVPNGQVGLVNLITPMVAATPILSVMTDDLGILHDGSECGCGINMPYLEIIGRIGMKEIMTCAAGAEEHLSGGWINDTGKRSAVRFKGAG